MTTFLLCSNRSSNSPQQQQPCPPGEAAWRAAACGPLAARPHGAGDDALLAPGRPAAQGGLVGAEIPGWLEVCVLLNSRNAPCASPHTLPFTGPVPVTFFWKVPVDVTSTGSTDGMPAPR